MDPKHPVWKIMNKTPEYFTPEGQLKVQQLYDLLTAALNKMTEDERRLLFCALDSWDYETFTIIASTCGDINGPIPMQL